jgi:hypothetical protein
MRDEMHGLYEPTRSQLQAARADAAREKQERIAAISENQELRAWNAQLSEELSGLVARVHADDADAHAGTEGILSGAAAADGDQAGLPRASANLVSQLLQLAGGSGAAEQRVARRLAEGLALAMDAPADPSDSPAWDRDAGSSSASVPTAAAGDTPTAVQPRETELQVVGHQRLQLELAALSVRQLRLCSALSAARDRARADAERQAALQQSARDLFQDLAAATSHIARLEAHLVAQAELGAQLREANRQHAALSAELEHTEAQLRNAVAAVAPARERADALEARVDTARRICQRDGERAAELAAEVRALSEDSRGLQQENVQLRLLARSLGATEAQLQRPRRLPHAPQQAPPNAGHSAPGAGCGLRLSADTPLDGAEPAALAPRLRRAADVEATRRGSGGSCAPACAALAVREAGADDVTGADDEDEPMYALRTLQERLMTVRSSFAEAKQLAASAAARCSCRTAVPRAGRHVHD